MTARLLLILASASMFIAVAARLRCARSEEILDADMLAVWHTAVTYQIAHSLGMFAIALLMQNWHPAFSAGPAASCLPAS